MPIRTLRLGSVGEDVREIQKALNRNGASLVTDGKFGNHTRDAVLAFQRQQHSSDPKFSVDGAVGPQTRRALFPLVAVTTSIYGVRVAAPGPLNFKPPAFPPIVPNLNLPPLTLGTPSPVTIPGLKEPIAFAPVPPAPSSSIVAWQQIAQTQRQFSGLFHGPFVDSFAVGVQSVFFQSPNDNHVELTTGCLLQGPINIQDNQGNSFTLACFANATWVDPILHLGMFHLVNPYAQLQGQGNSPGPLNPTVQVSGFPVNINVDLDDNGLQLNFNAGASLNLLFNGTGVTSSWGTVFGFGLVGKFQSF